MSKNINLFGIALAAIVVGSISLPAAAQWATCPSPYNGLSCNGGGGGAKYCEWNATNSRIECYGSANADKFYVVEESNNPWAYGHKDGTDFCCAPADLGGSSGVNVYMYMNDGNDIVCLSDHNGPTSCTSVSGTAVYWDGTSEILGGGGDDKIETSAEGGTSHYDDVDGGGEADVIYTFNGDDDVSGGSGGDTIRSGNGDDTVYGGSGNDDIAGGDGNDDLFGEGDNDTIAGDEGLDVIDGGSGNDTLSGGDDADYISGGTGNDTINGNLGADEVCGGDDADYIYGNAGDNDCVCGGDYTNGNDDGYQDYLYGGAGVGDECKGYTSDVYDTGTCEVYGDNSSCPCTNC